MNKSDKELDAIFWDQQSHYAFIQKHGKAFPMKNPLKFGIRFILSSMSFQEKKFSTNVLASGTIVISRK